MDNDHGITGELREWASCAATDRFRQIMLAIADRIDAEHEKTMAAAAFIAGVPMTDERMAEHGWVKLPKDADGEYIHVGDAVTCGATVWTVTGLKFLGEGWGICCTVYNEYGGSGTSVYPPSDLRHYQPPTVEDVLYDSLRHFGAVEERTPEVEEWLHEQAAKLRLAGDE